MSDLIWIGNTLYPRWFVIGVPTAMIMLGLAIVFITMFLRRSQP